MLGTLRGEAAWRFCARHGGGHRVSPSELNFRANIFGMKTLGVEFILAGERGRQPQEEYKPADIVIPDQFFDRTQGRAEHASSGAGWSATSAFAHPFCEIAERHRLRERRRRRAPPFTRAATYVCMEGPQFSTLAESKLYRSWGMDIIGMTNLQEAKLAREAEICYATIALVTDYDCWHPDHDSVTVEMVDVDAVDERGDRAADHRRRGRAAAVRADLRVRVGAEVRADHAAGDGARPGQEGSGAASSGSTFSRS